MCVIERGSFVFVNTTVMNVIYVDTASMVYFTINEQIQNVAQFFVCFETFRMRKIKKYGFMLGNKLKFLFIFSNLLIYR